MKPLSVGLFILQYKSTTTNYIKEHLFCWAVLVWDHIFTLSYTPIFLYIFFSPCWFTNRAGRCFQWCFFLNMNPFQSSGIFMGAFFLESLTVRYDSVGYASSLQTKMSLVSSTMTLQEKGSFSTSNQLILELWLLGCPNNVGKWWISVYFLFFIFLLLLLGCNVAPSNSQYQVRGSQTLNLYFPLLLGSKTTTRGRMVEESTNAGGEQKVQVPTRRCQAFLGGGINGSWCLKDEMTFFWHVYRTKLGVSWFDLTKNPYFSGWEWIGLDGESKVPRNSAELCDSCLDCK